MGDTNIATGDFDRTGFFAKQMVQVFLIAALTNGLFWLVSLYSSGLRDPRYLDGWVLACGMSLQLGFHVALKTTKPSPRTALRWRTFHIFLGLILISAFISHCDFTLPDSGFEWALWACFVLVTITGIFGTYLAWALKAKRRIGEGISYERITTLRAGLATDVYDIVIKKELVATAIGLPEQPHNAWILDLYHKKLRGFFQQQRNVSAHLIGSQRPVRRLVDEIDTLSRYVDQQSQEKLCAIRNLVVEKDELDFASVYLGLTKGWLFVHVPVTYSLLVLTVLHVVVVYAFANGVW